MKITLSVMLFLGLLIVGCSEKQEVDQRIVFMENATVFDQFKMKKEYDKQMEKELKAEAQNLDSMAAYLNNFKGDETQLNILKTQFYAKKQAYDEQFQELSIQYTNEVNDRLNTYIEEYAKKKGYRMILSSTGEGNVMYVAEKDNVTKDLLEFVNKKYAE